MKMFKDIYKNKSVLITGNTGFKGSWLTVLLIELGAKVIGYSLKPYTNPNMFNVLQLGKKITHITGDTRDEHTLKNVLKKYKPEIVFHLAAQPLVRLSYKEPKLTYETNILGLVNLLEAVKGTEGVKVVVNVTSDKCYDNKELIYGYRETDPMGGYDPYSSSKGAAEIITAAYRSSFFNPKEYGKKHNVALASVRAGNVIGGGDWSSDRIIPDCMRALMRNETIVIRDPKSLRPWQYVLEPLSGYLWLGVLMLQNGKKYSDGWNFGPIDDDLLTVEELVKTVINLWGKGKYKVKGDNKYYESKLLKLDISKSFFKLKWKPVYRIDKALENTVYWYKNYSYGKNIDMYRYTLSQVEEYSNNAKELNLEWTGDANYEPTQEQELSSQMECEAKLC